MGQVLDASATRRPLAGLRERLVRRPPPLEGVRRRRPRDLGTCTRLLHRAFFEGLFPGTRPPDPRAWLEGPDVLDAWVAERDGDVVGHVALLRPSSDLVRWREITGHLVDDVAVVGMLFVRPRYRGRGIGTAMVRAATDEARARGLVAVNEVVGPGPLPPVHPPGVGWRLRDSDRRPGAKAMWVHRFENVEQVGAL